MRILYGDSLDPELGMKKIGSRSATLIKNKYFFNGLPHKIRENLLGKNTYQLMSEVLMAVIIKKTINSQVSETTFSLCHHREQSAKIFYIDHCKTI
jgi:hypothetical protein